jgi:hypothetical protein
MKRAKVFLGASSVAFEALERKPAVEAMRKRRIVHGASLTRFLIFCKKLSETFAHNPGRELRRKQIFLFFTPNPLKSPNSGE